LFAANPAERFYRNLLTGGYSFQGEAFFLTNKPALALERYQKGLQMAQSIANSDADDLESRLQIAKLHDMIGVVRVQAGEWDMARHEFDLSGGGLRELLQLRPQDADGLYNSGLVEKHRTLLDSCAASNTCRPTSWPLPSPTI
jgi:hypothetical protein